MTAKKKSGVPVAFHKAQIDFINSDALKRGYCGGRGAGKSFVGSYDLIKKAKNGRLYMVAAPTFGMMSDSTFRSFLHVGNSIMGGRILREKHGSDFWCKVATFEKDKIPSSGKAEVIFRTASEPERLRGPNLSGLWLDEASVMAKEALDIAMATLREGGDAGFVNMTFTPKGKQHWTYKEFFDERHQIREYCKIFHSKQSDNPTLNKIYIKLMEAQYGKGSRLSEQELHGLFMDIDGMMFRREWFKIVKEVPRDGQRIRYWDKAGTEDGGCYSVGTLMCRGADGVFYVEDVVRGQWSYYKRNQIIKQVAEIDAHKYDNQVTIWIEQEPASGGKESALISVQDLAGYPVYLDSPQSAKADRAKAMSAQAEALNICIRSAIWNDDWLEEFGAFPEANFKDQVDSGVGAFNKLALGGFRMGSVESLLVYPYTPEKNREIEQLAIDNGMIGIASETNGASRNMATEELLSYFSGRRS